MPVAFPMPTFSAVLALPPHCLLRRPTSVLPFLLQAGRQGSQRPPCACIEALKAFKSTHMWGVDIE